MKTRDNSQPAQRQIVTAISHRPSERVMTAIKPPTIDEVQLAAERLRSVVRHTQLVPLHSFEGASNIWLKPEIHQAVNSFKIRGVFNAVAELSESERRAGISTVSAGNTAQALAWTGRHFGVTARSIMPDTAPAAKVDAVRAYGGIPDLVPMEQVFRYLREHLWEQENFAFIHPWINRHVMIVNQDLCLLFFPKGGCVGLRVGFEVLMQPKCWIGAFCCVVLLSMVSATTLKSAEQPSQPRLGINLSGPADWNTELPLVDVFHLSREWISQRKGAAWGKGPKLELDGHGWVKRLEKDCFAETPLCTIEGGHFPSGEWTILWEGDGKIDLSKGQIVAKSPGKLIAKIDSANGGFFLRVRETNPANPIRDIRVLMPGFTPAAESQNPWSPAFLARWRGVACLRFMDFQETNNSRQRDWSDRPKLTDATFTRQGVPIELLCDLANRLAADAWFCVPHEANDEYVREFARLVKAKLDPQRKVYIEYSNEVWNGQFQQSKYAGEQGIKLGFAEKPWEAAWRYTAHRSTEIFHIWKAEFGDRLVRVLPTQAANSYVASQIAGWKDTGRRADVLAIAPYISMNIPSTGKKLTAAEVSTWTVEKFLDYVEANALPESIRWMQENSKIADQYGLKLVCYEAGQHFVGVQGGENNESLTKLLHAANAHPRMRDIYRKYYAGWESSGGDLLCHFSSVSLWSKWGSWGLLQHADDNPAQSPKFIATMEWAAKLGQRVTEQ